MSNPPFSWTSPQRRGKQLPQLQTASTATSSAPAPGPAPAPARPPAHASNPSNNPAAASQHHHLANHHPSASVSSSSRGHAVSRASSVSSQSSLFSPSHPQAHSHSHSGVQHAGSSALHSSRARTIPSSAHPSLPSAVAAQGGAGGDGGAGGSISNSGNSKPRLSRASPSLSQSSDLGSPIPQSATSAPFSGSGGVASIDIAQVSIQLARLDKEKDPQKLDEGIRSLGAFLGQSMDVTLYTVRKLIRQHSSRIFGNDSSTEPVGSWNVLANEVESIRTKPDQAKKIADAIDINEGEPFRDFDLSTFMDKFKLDAVAKCMLALAFKTASKADLRTKADAILTNHLQHMFMMILNPASETGDDLSPSYLTALIDRLLQNPPRNWNEETQHNLNFAVRARYDKLGRPTPSEVISTMQLAELTQPSNELVRLVQRTGETATSSLQVASVLLFMVITQNGEAYNPSIFVQALKEHRAGRKLDWQDVVGSFDREGLVISKQQFLSIYRALLPLAQEYENFDIQLLWGGSWTHIDTQLSFVVAFLSCTSDELNADEIPRLRRAYEIQTFQDASDEVKEYAAQAVRHPLVSLDATSALFKMIFQNHETYKHAISLGIPETVINPHTPYFVVACASVPHPWGSLQEQAFEQLFSPFLRRALSGYSFVFHAIWERDNQWLAERLVRYYSMDPSLLSHIYHHAVEHDWLLTLTTIPTDFGIDLACYAHGHGNFDIETWLQQAYANHGNGFPLALHSFVTEKAKADMAVQKGVTPEQTLPLSLDTAFVLLTWLGPYLSEDHLISLNRDAIGAYPRLINYGEGFDEIIRENAKNGHAMSPGADAMMQDHFKALYNRETDVKSMIENLQRYKNSENAEEQELFACMIQGLFDEYSCFGEYPPDALATTAVLFGSIINFNLLSSIALQAGLSMVLEALQSATSREDKMYKFGLQALVNFQSKLNDWPAFCEKLLAIPELQGTDIFRAADDIVRNNLSANSNGEGLANGVANGVMDDLAGEASQPFSSLSEDPPLRPEIYQEPDEETQDRVIFAVNNISDRNIEEKFRDIRDAVTEELFQWFAVHLVEDRARSQPNYHELFLRLLALFDNSWLWKEVIHETIGSCVRLLNADATQNNSNDRNQLKNLGTWLGLLTLARDKPIYQKNIAFADLLVEAHKSKRLLLVIPFVCRVLKAVANSSTFAPPNPWTDEILSILAEFYHHIDMKIQLKFEIEVLCKDINTELKKIEPSVIIRESDYSYNNDYSANVPDDLAGFNDLTLANFSRQNNRLGDRFSPQVIINSLPDISSRLFYPPTNSANQVTNEQNRTVFLQAAETAIREIIFPVVERSVTIAGISASNLVMKDFATEPDEEKFRQAAYSMVKSLAGSLALVTCREPLRMSMSNNIRALARTLPSESLPEGVIIMFVNDNIDIVCKVVEEAAEKQSVAVIDDAISDALLAREQHRQQNTGEPFQWPGIHRFARMMPEPYKPSEGPGGLTQQQLAIYDNFGPTRAGPSHASGHDGRGQLPDFADVPPMLPNVQTPLGENRELAGPLQPSPLMHDGVRTNGFSNSLEDLLNDVFDAAKNAPGETVSELTATSAVKAAFANFMRFFDGLQQARQEGLATQTAEHVLQVLFSNKLERRIEIEVSVHLLVELTSMSSLASQRIWQMLNDAELTLLFDNPKVITQLLIQKLIPLAKIDRQIATALSQRDPQAVHFLAELLENMIFCEYPSALRADFAMSLEALSQWMTEDSNNEIGARIFDRMNSASAEGTTNPLIPTLTKQDQFEHIFDEWVHYVSNGTSEKMSVGFVLQLHKQDVLKDQNSTANFLRTCVDFSIQDFERLMDIYGDNAYLTIDALAQLIVLLVQHHGESETGSGNGAVKPTKPAYLDSVLSLLAVIQCHHVRDRGEGANHKIFFRLYSSLLWGFHRVAADLGNVYDEIVMVFGGLLVCLQPKWMPGFACAWLGLVSHRFFVNPILRMGSQANGWDMYAHLMEILLKNADQILPATEISRDAAGFVAGVLRHMLVLHHDFQDFLIENHAQLSAAAPARCIQIKNLISTACPHNVELPDPFATGLKIDRLEDSRRSPVIRLDINGMLERAGVKVAIDELLAGRRGTVIDLASRLGEDIGTLPVMQSVALYAATNAIAAASSKGHLFNKAGLQFKLLSGLVSNAPAACAVNLLNAMVNHLRYPNAHTLWFSQALVELFVSGVDAAENANAVQEWIAAILLERMTPMRPHPWGVLVTFLELVRNKDVEFQALPFVRDHEEVWARPRALEQVAAPPGMSGALPGMGGF